MNPSNYMDYRDIQYEQANKCYDWQNRFEMYGRTRHLTLIYI